eukprot:525397-Hanusia_phi.AAC.5
MEQTSPFQLVGKGKGGKLSERITEGRTGGSRTTRTVVATLALKKEFCDRARSLEDTDSCRLNARALRRHDRCLKILVHAKVC